MGDRFSKKIFFYEILAEFLDWPFDCAIFGQVGVNGKFLLHYVDHSID